MSIRRGWLASVLLLVIHGALAKGSEDGSAVAPALVIPRPERLDRTLDEYVDKGAVPLLYARLEDRAGNVLYEHAAVNRELLPHAHIDGDTLFRIWSMSKAITIAVTLDLVERGVLTLDDAVTQYIPEFASLTVASAPGGGVLLDAVDRAAACPLSSTPVSTVMTVRHLLNHQAGFYYTGTDVPCLDAALVRADVMASESSDALIARLAALPLIQQPGASYHYGMNTTVLGLVAERAAGQTLAELVRTLLSEPLGIDGLHYALPPDGTLLPRFSGADGTLREAYDGELGIFGGKVPSYAAQGELYLGGEGMLATADAYADFLRMLLNRGQLGGQRLLDEGTVKEMTAPHTQLDSDWGHNGYNLWVNSGKLVQGGFGQGGLWIVGGYEGTFGWVDPVNGFVGVVMSQVHAAEEFANTRHDVFREAVYDQLLEARRGTEYKLYYLGGQSNMDGYGYNDTLPAAYRHPVEGAMIYRGVSRADLSEWGGVGLWEALGPGFGVGYFTNGYESWHSNRYGPELSFARRMAALNADAPIALVKYSRGGTPLHVDADGYGTWSPEVEGTNQYDFALRALHEARAVRDIDGDGRPDRLRPAGIVWMQGEADAFDSEQAALAYEANLRRMMDLFRAALGVDDLPVVVGRISDSGRDDDGKVMDWSDTVREAQQRYVDSDACARLVTVTDDLTYPEDDAWHYDSAGYLRLGEAFAEAMTTLQSDCQR